MNTLNSFIKKLRLGRFLALVLAGMLLLTTACSARSDVQARVPGTTFPKASSNAQGGMNEYSDVDPRVNTAPVSARAKALQDRVESNVNSKRADSVDQYVENYRSGTPLNERTDRAIKGLRESAEDVGEDVQDLGGSLSNKAQRATDNVKQNSKSAARDAAGDFKQAGRDTQRALDNAGKQLDPNRA